MRRVNVSLYAAALIVLTKPRENSIITKYAAAISRVVGPE